VGQTVSTPDGPARVVQLRPTGEILVAPLDDSYCRQYRRSELGAIIDTPPATAPATPPASTFTPETIMPDGRDFKAYYEGARLVRSEPAEPAPIREPQPAPGPEPVKADHTSDCRPLPPDPDPLRPYRRWLLSRPFPAWAIAPQPR